MKPYTKSLSRAFVYLSIFALSLFLSFLLSSCSLWQKNKYKPLLNEKMEQIRQSQKKIKRLKRENRVLYDRNLDLEKKKQLLSIKRNRLQKKYQSLKEKYQRELASAQKEIKSLEEQITVLKKSSKKQIANLVALHDKEKKELQNSLQKLKKQKEQKIRELSQELDRKEKKWAQREFNYKKNLRDLQDRLAKLEKHQRLAREKGQKLFAILQEILTDKLKAGTIKMREDAQPVTVWIKNDSIYQPFRADWKAAGLTIVKRIFQDMGEYRELLNSFRIDITLFTSPEWINLKKDKITMLSVPVGPPPQRTLLSEVKGANATVHQLSLEDYPFPVALASMRAWLWEKLFRNYFPNLKDYRLFGMPRASRSLPWGGVTQIVFHYNGEAN